MKKYLIIQTAFIGDVILSTVLIETIIKNDKNCQIDFVLKKGNESILENNPFITNLFTYDKSKKSKSLYSIIKTIRKEKYDYAINIHRYFSSGLMTALSGAKSKIGYHGNPMSFLFDIKIKHKIKSGVHEVDRINNLVQPLSFLAVSRPKLYFSKEQINKIKPHTSEPYICIAPGSIWFTKRAPINKWIEIINMNKDKKIYIIGSKEENSLALKILEKTKEHKFNIVNSCGKFSLMESALLLKEAEHAYVNDSAPLHLCSANNTNVTVLYCSTSPEFGFGPLSEINSIIQVNGLDCKPCGIHGHNKCPKGHFNCGNQLKIN